MIRSWVVAAVLLSFAGLCTAQKSDGYLKAKVEPGRAGIFLDGKYIGPAANFGITRKYTVPAGEHEMKLVDPRYDEITKKITITAGKTTHVTEAMKLAPLAKPPYGILRTPGFEKYTAVYVNGKFYGHADEIDNFAQGLPPPGTYDVKLVPMSGASKEEKITIEANKTSILKK